MCLCVCPLSKEYLNFSFTQNRPRHHLWNTYFLLICGLPPGDAGGSSHGQCNIISMPTNDCLYWEFAYDRQAGDQGHHVPGAEEYTLFFTNCRFSSRNPGEKTAIDIKPIKVIIRTFRSFSSRAFLEEQCELRRRAFFLSNGLI